MARNYENENKTENTYNRTSGKNEMNSRNAQDCGKNSTKSMKNSSKNKTTSSYNSEQDENTSRY